MKSPSLDVDFRVRFRGAKPERGTTTPTVLVTATAAGDVPYFSEYPAQPMRATPLMSGRGWMDILKNGCTARTGFRPANVVCLGQASL
jgi:hypothetical protein